MENRILVNSAKAKLKLMIFPRIAMITSTRQILSWQSKEDVIRAMLQNGEKSMGILGMSAEI